MIEPTKETQPYWDALRAGRLIVQRCLTCGVVRPYPRRFCPECGSPDSKWIDGGDHAAIYSFSVVFRAPAGFHLTAPYVVAIVELPIGIRMVTNILTDDYDSLDIGQNVRLKPTEAGEAVLPCFVPMVDPGAR